MGTVATSVGLAETEGIATSENAMGRSSVPPKKCKKMAAISGRLQPTTKSGTVLICDYIFVVLD
jgi:hypothetical protein